MPVRARPSARMVVEVCGVMSRSTDCRTVRSLVAPVKVLAPAAHEVSQVIDLSSDDDDIQPRRQRCRKLGRQQTCSKRAPGDEQRCHSRKVEMLGNLEVVELFSSDEEDSQPRRKRARDGRTGAGNTVYLGPGLSLNCKQVGATTLTADSRPFRGVVCELCRKPSVGACEALGGCNHRFCVSCLSDHVLREVNETIAPPANRVRNVMPGLVLCPSLSGCSRELSRQEIVRVIGKQEMGRYESWLLESSDSIYSGQGHTNSQNLLTRCIRETCRATAKYISLTGTGNSSLWQCTTCKGKWCCACGRQFKYSTPDVHATCTGSRRKELYLELLDVKKTWLVFAGVTRNSTKKARKSKKKGGGTGYGGSAKEFSTEQADAQRKEQEFHHQMEKHFRALRETLDHCGTLGRLNPATWALLQRANTLAPVLSHMLSNDSILDISWKSSCYLEVMAFLKSMGSHDGLLPELLREEGQERSDGDPVIISSMANLYQQSKLMLSRLPDEGRNMATADVDIQLALKLCESYEILKDQWSKHGYSEQPEQVVQDFLPVFKDKGKGKASCSYNVEKEHGALSKDVAVDPLSTVIEAYKKKLQPLQFRSLAMTDKAGGYRNYHFNEITNQSSNHTNRGRMLAIAKELASLATSLPLEWGSSIYLCVDEARADVMKALIVGPHGTPYQNGMFIFDVFLPADYPNVPPRVQFLTTGGGSVRFNPNLYATGYVCLSLLGTWQTGPSWMPGKSTLLQVLVSLQSLIFVEEPYYNEPGRESRLNPKAAQADNAKLRGSTLSIAVLAALRKPEPLFAEIIQEHFRFKRAEVEAQLTDWVGKGATQQVANDVRKEFRRLYGASHS